MQVWQKPELIIADDDQNSKSEFACEEVTASGSYFGVVRVGNGELI
jgi:hypothetical protein